MKNESDESEIPLHEEIQILKERVKSTPPEQVAYAIIKGFCDPRSEVTLETRAMFNTWIVNMTEAKEKALEKYFNDICEEYTSEEPSEDVKVCGMI